MKKIPVSHLKPRSINILRGEQIDFNCEEAINDQLLANNQSDVIVKSAQVTLTPSLKALIVNELNWLGDEDEDDSWAIYPSDKELKTVNVIYCADMHNVVTSLLLAKTIFIVDGKESTSSKYNAYEIKQGLLQYQEEVQKMSKEIIFDDNDAGLTIEQIQERDYEEELFTAITKRRYELPEKCFDIFMVNVEKEQITKIK